MKSAEWMYWLIFILAAFIVWMVLSSGEFSFSLTISSLLQFFSLVGMTVTIYRNKDVTGLSFGTMACYVLVYSARLISVLFYEGYLPYDKSGDWFY